MNILQNKIDFVAILTCKNANPNGDPLNGNQPRKTYQGYGEISDVCIKRKIRNRFIDMGENVFVQSDEKKVDGFNSLRERADGNEALKDKKKDKELYAKAACETWIDVRSFGQVFAFSDDKANKGEGVSVGVRGPVSIQPAFSIETINITSTQITKSVNSVPGKNSGKSSDTMGTKHRVDFGVYVLKGSINVQLAEKTGFSEEDAEKLKEALRSLFVNDCSSARPEGSMNVNKLIWCKHNCKLGQYSTAKVHDSVQIECVVDNNQETDTIKDYSISINKLEGLNYEEYEGI